MIDLKSLIFGNLLFADDIYEEISKANEKTDEEINTTYDEICTLIKGTKSLEEKLCTLTYLYDNRDTDTAMTAYTRGLKDGAILIARLFERGE